MLAALKHWIRRRQSEKREARKAKERPSVVTEAQRAHVKAHPFCAACANAQHVQGHHIKPYHLFPELAAAPSNFISLCLGEGMCHLEIGHGGDFDFYNPNVVLTAAAARSMPVGSAARALLYDAIKKSRLK